MSVKQAAVTAAVVAVLTWALALPAGAETRAYYLAAEEVLWDYAPAPMTLAHGTRHAVAVPKPWAGNTRKKKVRYVEYTDETFTTRKPQPPWLGILGPVIRAEVGDTVRVHFLNHAGGTYSVFAERGSEGLQIRREPLGVEPHRNGPRRHPGDPRSASTW